MIAFNSQNLFSSPFFLFFFSDVGLNPVRCVLNLYSFMHAVHSTLLPGPGLTDFHDLDLFYILRHDKAD